MSKCLLSAFVTKEIHTINAKGKPLGRVASKAATLLIGKHKPNYIPHKDRGDFVKVSNVNKIKLTGKKAEQKKYYRHSGYPGGIKEISLKEKLEQDPAYVIKHAIQGMLPNNKLRKERMKRLIVEADKRG